MKIGGGNREAFPAADCFAAGRAGSRVRFERSPFLRRAIQKNPFAFVASDIHLGLPGLRCAATRGFQHLPEIFLGLKESVLGSVFADFKDSGNFGVAEAFNFVEQKNVALMSGELRQRVLKRQTKRRMCGSSARFGAGMRLI